MITELSIDNYKAFVNFRLNLNKIQLFLGDNGTGKSSVFSVLNALQLLILGEKVDSLFWPFHLCAWDGRTTQSFAFTLREWDDQRQQEETYEYSVDIEHNQDENKRRIKLESLKWNGQTFYQFSGGEVSLYRQTGEDTVEKGAEFPFDWTKSFISSIPERGDNEPLIRFRRKVTNWFFLRIDPFLIETFSENERAAMNPNAADFCSWYRYIKSYLNPRRLVELEESLASAIAGFEQLHIVGATNQPRLLKARFNNGLDAAFSELSEGQKALIVLYTAVHASTDLELDLFIDEPDNFISIREVEPWLRLLEETIENGRNRQAILISHHPEIINHMAHGQEVWFHVSQNGPIQSGPFPAHEGLTPAETMARGWADE